MDAHLLSSYRIGVDGEWDLDDFGLFLKRYGEVYSYLYTCLAVGDHVTVETQFVGEPLIGATGPPDDEESRQALVDYAVGRFPWEGGWSSFHSYKSLKALIPPKHKAKLASVRFSSPGFIEFGGALIAIALTAKIIKNYLENANEIQAFYRQAYRDAIRRGLLRRDREGRDSGLTKDELEFVSVTVRTLITLLQMDDVVPAEFLDEDQFVGMKSIFSFVRRLQELLQFQRSRDARVDFQEEAKSKTKADRRD